MKTATKIWLITAASLTLAGGVIFASVMTALGWDFKGLSTVNVKTASYETREPFGNLLVDATTADIDLLPSSDEKCRVIYHETENIKYSVSVENGTLKITEDDRRSWFDHIAIHPLSGLDITVYLPEKEYTSFKIELTTGSVEAKNISVKRLGIDITTGRTELTDISCKQLISDGSTGDILLKNVVASESFDLERSTGDIEFISCDAPDIEAETSTGSITGSLLSGKIFKTETSLGSVSVPKNVSGGICDLETSTGNIKISIE